MSNENRQEHNDGDKPLIILIHAVNNYYLMLLRNKASRSILSVCPYRPATRQDRIWYPTTKMELDLIDKTYEDFVSRLVTLYPGFDDKEYMLWLQRSRHYDMPITAEVPDLEYPKDAVETWETLYTKLRELQFRYGCEEHKENLNELEKLKIFSAYRVPQFAEVNQYLKGKTGFQLSPIGGMINGRSFLYGLAHKVFFGSRYLRHKSVPFYAAEPDLAHELMGHVPLLANNDFAEFSQQLGIKSLGATDSEISQLAKIYFYSIEFGIIGDKILGAGILSSCSEIEQVGEKRSPIYPWDIEKILKSEFTLSDYQPAYYWANDILDMKKFVIEGVNLVRPDF